MTPLTSRAETLRTALESDDFPSIEAAVRGYLACFQSGPRSLVEVAQARDLFDWGAQTATARKARLADQLARITTVSTGYRFPRSSNTWHLDI